MGWASSGPSLAAAGGLLWALWDYKDFVILGGTAASSSSGCVRPGAATTIERKRIGAIIVLFVFATLFWGAFEQAGSSLNLFADAVTRNASSSAGSSRRAGSSP